MKYTEIVAILTSQKIITEKQAESIREDDKKQLFSIHWELKSLLYLGITLLSSGLGILVYENIDSIGHTALISVIAAVCVACFFYAIKNLKPFTWEENLPSTQLADFALLGGCLTFLTLEGYLQYQYDIFGSRYGLAALIPAIIFFVLAYVFDHRGVLSMAITALASCIGITIIPVKMWETFEFDSQQLIINALIFGIALAIIGWISEYKNFKKHFQFTYLIFGGNIAFIAGLAALFTLGLKIIYIIITALLVTAFIIYARKKQSYLYLLMALIYGYVAFTYLIFKYILTDSGGGIGSIYFVVSAGLIIYLLLNIKAIVKQ